MDELIGLPEGPYDLADDDYDGEQDDDGDAADYYRDLADDR